MTQQENFLTSVHAEKPRVLIEAERTADRTAELFLSSGVETIEVLLREIEDAKLADRFRVDIDIETAIENAKTGTLDPVKTAALHEGGEAKLKKLQLTSDIRAIQTELFSLSERLKNFVIEFEASKNEY